MKGLSVNTYTNVANKKDSNNYLINEDTKYLEYLCSRVIKHDTRKIATVISDISHLLRPIINAAYNK